MSNDFPLLFSRPLTGVDLKSARAGATFQGQARDEERRAIAAAHELASLDALGFEARLEPFGAKGWRLEGRVRAEFEQICVVTLEPVAARMDEPILRLWSDDAPEDGFEADVAAGDTGWSAEIPDLAEGAGLAPLSAAEEDAIVERTPDPIDPAAVALETFMLALDPYPRAPHVAFEGKTHGPPGAEPLTDEAARPFAGLDALRAAMERETKGEAGGPATDGSDEEARRAESSATTARPSGSDGKDAKEDGSDGENA